MSLSVSPELEAQLLERASQEGLSVDAYLKQVLREDDEEIARTEALLREAETSGEPIPLTDGEWDSMLEDARALARSRRA